MKNLPFEIKGKIHSLNFYQTQKFRIYPNKFTKYIINKKLNFKNAEMYIFQQLEPYVNIQNDDFFKKVSLTKSVTSTSINTKTVFFK